MTSEQHPGLSRAWPLYLLLLSVPAVVVLFLYGLPINPDGPIHLLRIARLHEAIEQGILFPRWMPDQLLGYGYPSLNYYASGSYYLVEALQLLGLHLYWAFAVAQSILLFLAAIGMYLFARDLMGKERFWPPFVAAIAYSYGPYLLHNLYVRGAIAELGAQMLLPWLLWSFRRIWRSDMPQHHITGAALILAALAFTHTISLLLIPPFLLGYIAILAWDANHRAIRLRWTAIAIGGAMAISCFYWLPLIAERGNVSELAYSISQQRFLPYSFLEVENFLYTSLSYIYTKELDYRLSIVQVIGILAGLPFVVRQSKEWWYWVGVLLLCGVMMTKLVGSLWFNFEILAIIQFPYRLLTLFQIPVALLTALPFCYIHKRQLRAVASVATIALLIWVYWPRLPWIHRLSPATSMFNMPMNAFFEADVKQIIGGGSIVTSLQEFRPRWVSMTLELEPETVDSQPSSSTVKPLAANPLHLRLQTSAPSAFPLRLNTFYFPGWQITLNNTTDLTPYPSTSLGLLTAEVPAGEHILDIRWAGTRVAFWAATSSQLALLMLLVWQLAQPGRRVWALALAPLLLLALVARYWQLPLDDVTPNSTGDQIPGVRLVGHGAPELSEEGITIYPYWYALETQPPELEVRWELYNEASQVVAQTTVTPFYDAYSAENWPANTLIDDAQFIPLPDALPAGNYQVVMNPLNEADHTPLFAMPLGTVTLDSPTTQVTPSSLLEVYFGEDILLKGYGLDVVERLFANVSFLQQSPDVALLYPGENLVYKLYWQLLHETDEPYSGFIHLTNRQGEPLAQRDQSPGPLFSPVAIWGTGRLYRDDYMLTIPEETTSGLYWPRVGMYNWEDVERFDVRGANGEKMGDHYQLPPVKIVNSTIDPIGVQVGAHFGEMAELLRYQILNPEGSDVTDSLPGPLAVAAGSALTLTTYYHVQQPTPTALTRFIQVRSATGQIVAQLDSEPQNGENPTWAWVEDEVVQDTVHLTIPAETVPGDYGIYLGFYEPSGAFSRLPVTNEQGVQLPNNELPLALDGEFLTVQVIQLD